MFENREGSRMARFFFHVKNDSTFKEEEEGENYPNLETARAHGSTVHDYLELWNWDGTLERRRRQKCVR